MVVRAQLFGVFVSFDFFFIIFAGSARRAESRFHPNLARDVTMYTYFNDAVDAGAQHLDPRCSGVAGRVDDGVVARSSSSFRRSRIVCPRPAKSAFRVQTHETAPRACRSEGQPSFQSCGVVVVVVVGPSSTGETSLYVFNEFFRRRITRRNQIIDPNRL